MMLVEHDVEAELVGELILVVIAMKQVGGDARIAFAVREDHAQRAGMLVPGRIIGLFAKLIDSHAARSARYRVGQIVRSAARRRHDFARAARPRRAPREAYDTRPWHDDRLHLQATKFITFSAKIFGCSSCGKCPARSISSKRAPGIMAQ